ncbi:MAG: glycosyltransferase family 2 protein [candidate division WOR-3 bacterium]
MAELPKITVVTPSYNQGKFLERTILSVINQNYPNLEYIIIDGGSTDNSIEIIRKYEKYLSYWKSEKDNGQADAIRKGFAMATGELIGWLNSDDMFFPGALVEIGKAYQKNPDASIYTGGIAIGALHDGPIKKCAFPPKTLFFRKYGIIPVGQQSTFFNRKYYEKIGGININFYHRMDADLIFRLVNYHPKIVRVYKMIGFIRFHGEAKSATAKELYIKEQNEFINSLGLSPFRYKLIVHLNRIIRLLTGDYFYSWFATLKYKGKRMESIWDEYYEKNYNNLHL